MCNVMYSEAENPYSQLVISKLFSDSQEINIA